ncbi:enoyl-CoA hydratase-related protein [Actinospica sp.]|uniref:enoyl-CoA hydratase-related protein n=1 Tax=Actinospica sp. TaxID=1872142 RepID=UPI002C7190B2|nr:enoyl-CoA hydratase-related protein [Actinospica sp.]HWG23573.1 enoyl-CoA hydratase-related protein [Actinospica sp.]
MRILLIATAFNSLAQRVYAELADAGHELEVVIAACGVDEVREAVFGPGGDPRTPPDFELCVAPMLTTAIPEDVWRALPCLIVHPGPPGDRGPSSLDWALHLGAETWGVTVLQAVAAMDAGPVWASAEFRIPPGVSKSDLYRGELADAASAAVHEAVRRFEAGLSPRPQRESVTRGGYPQQLRRIDWTADSTERVSALLRAADSSPGVLDRLDNREFYLYGGEPEYALRGRPGTLLATRTGAVCRATADGAVWISHAKPKRLPGGPRGVKLPAALALSGQVGHLPECPGSPEIAYRERGEVGMLSFGFPGGALSTEHCRRLLKALRHADTRRTRVLVLGGRRDFFGNGIHLGVIEAAADPAAESWANINAIDDVVEAVLRMTGRMVVAAMGGNAAAGGAVLGFAADEVWLRRGVVLNPHYRLMGLSGSEYWTYLLPRRVGQAETDRLMQDALPVSAAAALRGGLADRLVDVDPEDFTEAVWADAFELAAAPDLSNRIADKAKRLVADEAVRPLARYRQAELSRMRAIFDDPGAPYHALRTAFVRKTVPDRTPEHLRSAVQLDRA